jgi:pimeloyl-ACP methyl ester carboxylesterase
MKRLLTGLFALFVVVVAVLTAVPTPTAYAADPVCAGEANWTDLKGLVKQAHPVVLVHGWTGKAMPDFRTRLEAKARDGWQYLLFDYHEASTQWAASKDVSGCLEIYLTRVSDAHRAAGGDGLVYVVAHSMGGLATRFAAADPKVSARLGGLVSVATPHQGSPWGSAKLGSLEYGKFVETMAGLGFTDIPGYAAPARVCLAIHDGASGMPAGCELAPYLPTNVAVHEIGGNLTVRRTFFGIHAYDVPVGGDTIVGTGSSQGYPGSAGTPTPVGYKLGADQIECSMDAHALIAEAGSRSALLALPGVWAQLSSDSAALDAVLAGKPSPALVEFLVAANFFATCSHSGLLTNGGVVDKVAKALEEQVAWQQIRRNVTTATLKTAEVPAYCDMPQQRLVGGKTTKRNPDTSPYAQGSLLTDKAAYTDLANLGYKQALVPYLCGAGGVSWPQVLLLIGEGGTMLAAYELGDIGQAEHADVSKLGIDGDHATAVWTSYEGAGFDIVDHTSTVVFRDGKLEFTEVVPDVFALKEGSFGPLQLETSPDLALRVLTPVLGRPDTDKSGAGCELGGPGWKSRLLKWGDLLLYGEYNGVEYRFLDSWTLSGTHTPRTVSTPYGVTIGMTAAEAKKRIPGYQVDTEHMFAEGDILFKGAMWWVLDASNSKVITITSHPHLCE